MANKCRLRFSTTDDLELLRAVVAENPYEDSLRWNSIRDGVVQITGKQFTVRALKDHLDYLLKQFLQQDKINIKKSGTEEEYAEKERLLQEIDDLKREFCSSSTSKAAASTSKQKGLNVREQAAKKLSNCSYILQDDGSLIIETLHDQESVEDSSSTQSADVLQSTVKRSKGRGLQNSTLEFLKQKNASEQDLKQQQLNIEERRLALEERKFDIEQQRFELEREERRARLQAEIEERNKFASVMEQQQRLISFVLDKLNKKET